MENSEEINNSNLDNSTENIVEVDTTIEGKLDQIHQDLGLISCFIIFFVLVILLKYVYKFFDMVFKF